MTMSLQAPTLTTAPWPTRKAWTGACVLAETVGMTAAASAAVLTRHLDDSVRGRLLGLALVVAGGLVEGLALGWFQSHVLRKVLGARRRLWVFGTLLVAGLGWAAASAPSAFASDGDAVTPSLWLVLPGTAVLGAAMGAVLGAAQGGALRSLVSHPWRWTGISALAWAPAMAVIFLGATLPTPQWPDAMVILMGLPTGAAAGYVLGQLSGWLLPSLYGARPHDLFVLRVLHSVGDLVLGRSLVGLSFAGAVTGRRIELPVMYATHGGQLVVMPGHSESKHWWHNIDGHLSEVQVLVRRHWIAGVGEVVRPDSSSYDAVRTAYIERWPSVDVPVDQPFVVLSGLSRTPRGHR